MRQSRGFTGFTGSSRLHRRREALYAQWLVCPSKLPVASASGYPCRCRLSPPYLFHCQVKWRQWPVTHRAHLSRPSPTGLVFLFLPSMIRERTQDGRKKHLRALISNSMRIKSPPRTCASVAPAVSLSSPVNFQKVHVSFKQIRDWPTLFTFPHLPRETSSSLDPGPFISLVLA